MWLFQHYMQQTVKTVDKRLNERVKQKTSAVCEHQIKTGHIIDWVQVKVIDQESVSEKQQGNHI